jgi:hypothetical protein
MHAKRGGGGRVHWGGGARGGGATATHRRSRATNAVATHLQRANTRTHAYASSRKQVGSLGVNCECVSGPVGAEIPTLLNTITAAASVQAHTHTHTHTHTMAHTQPSPTTGGTYRPICASSAVYIHLKHAHVLEIGDSFGKGGGWEATWAQQLGKVGALNAAKPGGPIPQPRARLVVTSCAENVQRASGTPAGGALRTGSMASAG